MIGSSLAAATAAALSARLGVAGTIAGAAVISMVTAVAGALYTQSLHRTRTHVRAVAQAALHRTGTDPRPATAAIGPRARLTLRPRRLIAGVLVIFALAVGGITGFELLTGHPLSGGSTGTTLGELAQDGSNSESPGTGASACERPSPAPTDPAPTDPAPTGPTSPAT